VVRGRAKEAPLSRMRRAGLAAMAATAARAGGDGGVDGGLIMLRMMQRLCRRHRQTAGRARPGPEGDWPGTTRTRARAPVSCSQRWACRRARNSSSEKYDETKTRPPCPTTRALIAHGLPMAAAAAPSAVSNWPRRRDDATRVMALRCQQTWPLRCCAAALLHPAPLGNRASLCGWVVPAGLLPTAPDAVWCGDAMSWAVESNIATAMDGAVACRLARCW
jgi:hypothetical protein